MHHHSSRTHRTAATPPPTTIPVHLHAAASVRRDSAEADAGPSPFPCVRDGRIRLWRTAGFRTPNQPRRYRQSLRRPYTSRTAVRASHCSSQPISQTRTRCRDSPLLPRDHFHHGRPHLGHGRAPTACLGAIRRSLGMWFHRPFSLSCPARSLRLCANAAALISRTDLTNRGRCDYRNAAGKTPADCLASPSRWASRLRLAHWLLRQCIGR